MHIYRFIYTKQRPLLSLHGILDLIANVLWKTLEHGVDLGSLLRVCLGLVVGDGGELGIGLQLDGVMSRSQHYGTRLLTSLAAALNFATAAW